MSARIYKIVCNKTGMVYVGSTIQTLKYRLTKHKCNYKCYLNGKGHYTTSFKILENNDYYIDLIEEFNYNTKKDIFDKESGYIREIECVNKYIPNRTKKEYYNDNKDKRNEYGKKYYEDNKDKLNENKKKYTQDNKDKIRERKRKHYLYKTEITRLMNISLYFNEDD